MNVTRLPFELQQIDNYTLFSDFLTVRNDDEWVDTVTDSGTVTAGDAAGGPGCD